MPSVRLGQVEVDAVAVGWLFGLLTASVSMLVGNKYVAQHYHANNLTVLFQNAVAVLILWIGGMTGQFEMKPLSRRQFAAMLVPALLNSIQLLTSIKGLFYVAVATTVVFRNISTLLCASIEALYFGERFSSRAKIALLIIFAGSVIYAKEDLTFNATGYLWLTGNTIAYTINNVYTKLQVTKMSQTGSGIALVTLLLTLPIFSCLAYFWGEIPHGVYDAFELRGPLLAVFLFLGLMGTLISMSYNNLYKMVSATTVVVASNMNKVVAILLAWYVFEKKLSSVQMFGLCICMTGGLLYSIQVKKDKAASDRNMKPSV